MILRQQLHHIEHPAPARPAVRTDRLAAYIEQHGIAGHRVNEVPRFHDPLFAHDDARPTEHRRSLDASTTRHLRPALDLVRYRSDQALERRGCVTARLARRRRARGGSAPSPALARAAVRSQSGDRSRSRGRLPVIAAVTVNHAFGDAVHVLGKRPRAWWWFA